MIDGVIPHDEYIDQMFVISTSKTTSVIQLESAFPLDLFGVLAIEMVKDVQLVITPKLVIDVTFVDDVHDDIFSPVWQSLTLWIHYFLLMFCWDLSPILMYPFLHLWIWVFFQYLHGSYDDISLCASHSPISHVFDIDDESRHDLG